MLKKNESTMDRAVRIIIAFIIFAIGLGTGSWLGLIGFIPLVTGLMGSCPTYSILGISTCPIEETKS